MAAVMSAVAPTDPVDVAIKGRDRRERNRPLTKIVCRRLPPTMTEQSFLEQVAPIPEYDYFYYAKPDVSLAPNLFCRAYINFLNEEDIYIFRDKFDDYIFLDDNGVEYPAIVEYAPFQRMPKKRRKKDGRCGTIESDPIYLEFLESLKEIDSDCREPKMEYSYQPTEEKKEVTTTPLLEYLTAKKNDERRRREERQQRRRPKNRIVKDEETCEDKPKTYDNDEEGNEDVDDDDPENADVEIKESQFTGRGRLRNFRERKFEERKKLEFAKREKKDEDGGEDTKGRKHKVYKDKKEKFADRKDKSKFDRKAENFAKKSEGKDRDDHKADKSSHSGKGPPPSNKIKPFTQLPQLKISELSKRIDKVDLNRLKSEKKSDDGDGAKNVDSKESSVEATSPVPSENSIKDVDLEAPIKFKEPIKREDSEEKDRSNDPRLERRIRNKDRPSLVIYKPGMGKFSKSRIDRESKDKATSSSSSNSQE